MGSGTALAQLIALAAIPFLTRLFSPDQFGEFAVYWALIATASVVACLRYELAIPLPPTDKGAMRVAVAAFVVLGMVTLLLSALVFVTGARAMQQLGASASPWMLYALPVGVASAGLYQIGTMWAVRRQKYREVAVTRVHQGLSATGSQLAVGLVAPSALGLLGAQIAGQAVGTVRLIAALKRDWDFRSWVPSFKGLRWTLLRYRKFPLLDSPAALLNTAGAYAPAVVLAYSYGPVFAGFYSVAVRLLSAPVGLVGRSVAQVLLPDAVAARRLGSLHLLVIRTATLLGSLAYFPFFAIAALAPDYTPIVLGADWQEGGVIFAATATWVGLQFVYSPLSSVLLALEAQKENLQQQVVLFALRVGSLLICSALFGPNVAIIVFSLVSALYYLLAAVRVCNLAGASVLKNQLQLIVLSLSPVVVAVTLEQYFGVAKTWTLLCASIIYMMFVGAFLRRVYK